MYGIRSELVRNVIGSYRLGSADDVDYRRYLQFEDLIRGIGGSSLDQGTMSREGFEEDKAPELDVELEQSKEKRLKGERGVAPAVSKMFREMLEDYLPGGYFRWEDYARELSDNFYRMAYAQFSDLIPKVLSQKLKDFNIDRSEGSIETSPETINKAIMDSLIYLHDHPDIMKDGLVRAYRRREGEEDRGVGYTEAFFVPRIDAATLAERKKQEGEEGVSSEVKEGDTDTDVLANLENRKEVKWKWKGISEYGVLTFTLPELYGRREFTVKLPPEIQYIKPGEYTFKIKKVNERGAVLDFVEQHDSISSNAMDSIEADGLGEDQLRKFINNGVVNKYITYLRSLPGEKLVEEFLGTFSIGGNQITDVNDLAELGGEGESDKADSKARGKEKVKEKYEESIGRERDKLRQMIQRWESAPEIARHFMKMSESDGAHIGRMVASQFPRVSEKGVPSLDSIIATAPVVEMVMRYIMSPHVPLGGGGKSAPWIHFAWDSFQKMALKVPEVRGSIEQLVRKKRKDAVPDMPVSDDEVAAFLASTKNINMSFMRLKEKIGEAITASKGSPELKKFFERREVFQSYIRGQLEPAVEQYMEQEGLSLDRPEDVKKVEKFKDKFIDMAIKKMSKSAMSAQLIHDLMIRMSLK
jgi:hypothetical protein